MKIKNVLMGSGVAAVLVAVLALTTRTAWTDEFTKKDTEKWSAEYMAVVKTGRALWTDGKLGTNGVACAQCHPNGANTHPETYPKFQKQLGRVIALREMINWCLRQPLEGTPLPLDDPQMIALEAYIHHERRGVKMEPGKH
jgi:thiosulfate dehydrogenase